MKKFKLFLIGMLAAMVSLVATGCGSDDDGNVSQDAHNQVSAQKMHDLIQTCNEKQKAYMIVDYRSNADYTAEHVKGAKWIMEADNHNMDDKSFAKAVKDACPNGYDTYIFLVGYPKADQMMTLAGSVSSAGFHKVHTYILLGGVEAWKAAFPSEME